MALKSKTGIVLAAMLALSGEGELFAQVAVPKRAREIMQITISSPENYRGRIRDLVLDDTGRVAYLLIEHEGRLVLMPWQWFSEETGDQVRPQVRSYFEPNDTPARGRSAWDRALEKALHEVPQ